MICFTGTELLMRNRASVI